MRLLTRPEETIEGIGLALREGRTSCVELVERCLAAVDEWEPKVKAWVTIDRIGAVDQARERDADLKSGRDLGPLHGLPVGIKDIIDVSGLETRSGSPRPSDWKRPPDDAEVVRLLRAAGAVILGKTVTTPFAWIDPPQTRNPWDLDRTPGGSSSGSAVAVATGMCLAAVGSQTGGSIIRPASFCGVAGLKPTFGTIARDGVFPFAPSLDTLGPLARTVRDLRLLFEAIGLDDAGRPISSDVRPWVEAPRLGQLRGLFLTSADPEMKSALARAIAVWTDAGAECEPFDLPEEFGSVHRLHRTVMAAEAASFHRDDFESARAEYPPRMAELLAEGLDVKAVDYIDARDDMSTSIAIASILQDHERHALVTPAAIGPAPGIETTGDPIFNSPWTYSGLPTVTFPIGLSSGGLPLGVQLVGKAWEEAELFAVAEWCERAIRPHLAPEGR